MHQTTNKLEVQSNPISVYDYLLMANSILNTETNVKVELTLTDKVVYSYISHHVGWLKALGKSMFESQETISNAISVERRTVSRSIKKLEQVGVLLCSRQKRKGVTITTYDTLPIVGEKFKMTTTRCTRVRGSEDVVEELEIVVKNKLPHTSIPKEKSNEKPDYLTGAELVRQIKEKHTIKLYDYENDDTVIPY